MIRRRPLFIYIMLIGLTTACGGQVLSSDSVNITPIIQYPPTASSTPAPKIVATDPVSDIAQPVAFVTAVPFNTPRATIAVATDTAIPPTKSLPKPSPTPLPSPTVDLGVLPTAPPVMAAMQKSATSAKSVGVLTALATAPAAAIPTATKTANLLPTPTSVQGQFPKSADGLNGAGGPNNDSIVIIRDNLMARTNSARIAAGLPALRFMPLLQQAAQQHADECAQFSNCSHFGANGSTLKQRLQRVGYSNEATGENWAWARSTAVAWDMWFDQEYPDGPHRRNILSPYYREVGFGIAAANGGFYLITNFGGSFR